MIPKWVLNLVSVVFEAMARGATRGWLQETAEPTETRPVGGGEREGDAVRDEVDRQLGREDDE
jgi:hypothetical protein